MQSLLNNFKFKPFLLLLFIVSCFFSQSVVSNTTDNATSRGIAEVLAAKHLSLLRHSDFSLYSREVQKLYPQSVKRLLWLGKDNNEKNLNDALDVLNNAAADGLSPESYDADLLRIAIQQAMSLSSVDVQTLVTYDVALTVSLLRFLHDLHSGQVDPRSLNYPASFGSKVTVDFVAAIKTHVEQQNIAELPLDLAPDI